MTRYLTSSTTLGSPSGTAASDPLTQHGLLKFAALGALRGAALFVAAALALAACGSGDGDDRGEAASGELAAATSALASTAAPIISTTTSAPTTTSTTPAPTTTTTTTTEPPVIGPRHIDDFASEWRSDLSGLADEGSQHETVAQLADLWERDEAVVEEGGGRRTMRARASHEPVVDIEVRTGEGSNVVEIVEITSSDPLRDDEGDVIADGPLFDTIQALLWTLEPRASVSRLDTALDDVLLSPERRREEFVSVLDHVFEVHDDGVGAHLDQGPTRSFEITAEVLEITGDPLLLGDYLGDIGMTRDWTIDVWGTCEGPGAPCIVFLQSGLLQTSLLQNQVGLELESGRHVGVNRVEIPQQCGRTDGGMFETEWNVTYDFEFVDGNLVTGTVETDPVDGDLRGGGRRCLLYRYLRQLDLR